MDIIDIRFFQFNSNTQLPGHQLHSVIAHALANAVSVTPRAPLASSGTISRSSVFTAIDSHPLAHTPGEGSYSSQVMSPTVTSYPVYSMVIPSHDCGSNATPQISIVLPPADQNTATAKTIVTPVIRSSQVDTNSIASISDCQSLVSNTIPAKDYAPPADYTAAGLEVRFFFKG